jgi:hypothetical protein
VRELPNDSANALLSRGHVELVAAGVDPGS